MRFELFIALRHLRGKHRSTFVSIITLISVVGVAFGVMVPMVVLAVMTGFAQELQEKILGAYSHIIVQKPGGIGEYREVQSRIEAVPSVLSVAPVFYGQVLLRSRAAASGALLRGIVPEEERQVTDFAKNLIGTFEEDGIVLGIDLARRERLDVKIGEHVTVLSPNMVSTPIGERPLQKRLRVCGLYRSGMAEHDATFCFVSLGTAQALLSQGDVVSAIEVKLDDPFKAETISRLIEETIGPQYVAQSWMALERNFFLALRHEKIIQFIILVLITVVAALNIANPLIMSVMEKTKDIGILKAIGTPVQSIRAIFIIQGMTVGLLGTVLGVIGGLALGGSLNFIVDFVGAQFGLELFPKNIYLFDEIPVNTNVPDTLAICTFAIIVTFIASLYPAWRASRLDPVEAVRYE